MTMLLHDGTNHNGLFDVLGTCFYALDTLNTAAATTVPSQVIDFIAQAELINGGSGQPTVSAAVNAMQGVPTSLSQWQNTSSTIANALQTAAQNILIAYTQQDNSSLGSDLASNMTYLVSQMAAGTVTGGNYVTAPTTGVSLASGSNSGDVALAATLIGGTGLVQQNALPETITVSVNSAGFAPVLNVASPPATSSRLSYSWPGGSGLSTSFSAVSAASSFLANGNFETDTIANQPDNWLIDIGTPGTTLFVTGQCVQTVTIAGSPTAGSYILCWTDQYGTNRATTPLPWNATQRQVQSALQAITGLGNVTVATTGTSPNYTHTITFQGVGGAVSTLTYLSQLSGGTPSITVAVTTAADANTYNGQALKLVGNGTELTTLYNVLSGLSANTTYFLGFRARTAATETISAGSLAVEIVNGIGGSVIDDAAGNANSLTVNLTTLSNTAWQFFSLGFRIPPSVIQPVYLRLRLATAITSGKAVYLDEAAIVAGTELYSGGPIVAAFSGKFPAAPTDTWTITVSNDFGGKFQKDFGRFFGMADLDLVLPTSGSTLIPDSLIT